MKFLLFLLLLLGYNLSAQQFTVTTTNIHSIRFINSGIYTNAMVICNFGQVININENFQGGDIGAFQTKKLMENRTIITFDIKNIPLIISNKPIVNVTLTIPLQNQENGEKGGTIDLFYFYNENSITIDNWNKGIYYKSFPDMPDIQKLDVTSLIQSAKSNGYTNLNLKLSTSKTNFSCVFVNPSWRTNKTSLVVIYSSSNILPHKNLRSL